MSDERKLILKMLQENRISIDEADQLIGALTEKARPETEKPGPKASSSQDNIFNKTAPKMDQIVGTISSMIDSVSSQLGPGLEKRFESWFQQRGPQDSSKTSDSTENFHEKQTHEDLIVLEEGTQKLSCFNRIGNLNIEGYDGKSIQAILETHIHTSSVEEKLKYEDLKVLGTTEDDVLRVSIAGTEGLKASHLATVNLTLKIPNNLDLDLSTEKYDISLEQLSHPERQVKLSSRSGDLTVRHVALKHINLSSDSGDIEASQASESIQIQTQSGDIRLSGSVYEGQVRSQSGNIAVEASVQHLLKAEGRSSDIVVQKLDGTGRLNLQTQSGDIELTATLTGENVLNSASGDLQCDLNISEHASASLTTHSGDLDLILRPQSQCRLDIEAPNGDIECRLDVVDKVMEEHSLKGQLGNGEGILRAKTNSGDVLIS